jgi:nucleotide-binding universal stress UspA family protein
MKRILCPTDFSPASLNGINYAASLARDTGSELALLNVQPLSEAAPAEFVAEAESSIKAAKGRLEVICAEVSATFGIRCTAGVEPTYDKPTTVISEKSQESDLLIMGSNGADDLYQFFFGSNTYNALVKAKTPALIIPEGQEYTAIRTIVYAFDYLSEGKLPIGPLEDFARTLKASVTVLQVMEEAISEVVDQDLKDMQLIVQSKTPDFPLNFETIRSSDVPKSIDSFVVRSKPDALALCSQSRNFIENMFHRSVIKNISAICSYPVYVFPE